ncbi:hypothetical protein, partial [Tatumella ptyseos]|uniref:hypothetical protein n=1 Tax=Tatumella ptyseos TaxID=82987 RepID=UPI00056E629C
DDQEQDNRESERARNLISPGLTEHGGTGSVHKRPKTIRGRAGKLIAEMTLQKDNTPPDVNQTFSAGGVE